jgi:ATP-dependent RNA helicase DDX21
LHGDIPQDQREINFKDFRQGKLKCLVATNVAARGLDIPEVDFIIQLEPPKKVDDYIHRSGRTGRAGKTGVCLTIYTSSERYLVRQIEQMANIKIK